MIKLNTEKYETKRFIRGINLNLAAAGVVPSIFGEFQIPDCRYPEKDHRKSGAGCGIRGHPNFRSRALRSMPSGMQGELYREFQMLLKCKDLRQGEKTDETEGKIFHCEFPAYAGTDRLVHAANEHDSIWSGYPGGNN